MKLKSEIRALRPTGGTRLYDGIYTSIMTHAATSPQGKRILVVMTDGVDEAPGSRHNYKEVIELARRENVHLHLVGFGREHEINKEVMQKMAEETQGIFVHADNAAKLKKFFDDERREVDNVGINEEALTKLAHDTGGKYYSAEDPSKLAELVPDVTQQADESYHPAFKSLRDTYTGTMVGIELQVFDEVTGQPRSQRVGTAVHLHGVVPPGLDWRWYLGLLMLLGCLLAVPPSFRGMMRLGSGK